MIAGSKNLVEVNLFEIPVQAERLKEKDLLLRIEISEEVKIKRMN